MKEEFNYLLFLKELSEVDPNISFYGVDKMRTDLHIAILKKHGYEDYYDKSKMIFEHLDKAIDFKLPLEIWDHIKPYAEELRRLLGSQECTYYLQGKTGLLRTNYWALIEGKWTKK